MKTEPPDGNNAPNILAYRVGKLEEATAELKLTVEVGQEKLDRKLTELMLRFATKAELNDNKKQAHEEHERIWTELKRLDIDVKSLDNSVKAMDKSSANFTLVQKIVFGLSAIMLLALANSGVREAAEHLFK